MLVAPAGAYNHYPLSYQGLLNYTAEQFSNWTAAQQEHDIIGKFASGLIGKSIEEALSIMAENTTNGRRLSWYLFGPRQSTPGRLATFTHLSGRPWYSAKDEGRISGVRDQRQCGSCWAFGSLAIAEAAVTTTLKRQNPNAGSPDFSEAHLFYCQAGQICETLTNCCADKDPFTSCWWERCKGIVEPDFVSKALDMVLKGVVLEGCVPQANYTEALTTDLPDRKARCNAISQAATGPCPVLKDVFDKVEISCGDNSRSMCTQKAVGGLRGLTTPTTMDEMSSLFRALDYATMMINIKQQVREWGAVGSSITLFGPVGQVSLLLGILQLQQ